MGIENIVDDWPTVMKRWEAWWQYGLYDRPIIAVTAPRTGATPKYDEKIDPLTQWTDVSFMVRRQLEQVRTTYFGGEALPIFWHNWSAGHSLYFGCKPHFAPDTVWVDPAPVGDDGYPSLDNWHLSPWWQWMQVCTKVAVQESHGRYFILPMWGNHAGDNLGLIRGTEQLLIDLLADKQWVTYAIKALSDIQIQVFDALWQLVTPERVGVEGSINYVGGWSPLKTLAFDCDLSCMISDEMFRKVFLPPLVETMCTVDHRIYHLDGWVALHHLDSLLDLPELHAIQWLPGAGREDIRQWLPVIHKVQSKGKGIALYVTPEEIDFVLEEVKPEGLMLNTNCGTESEARALLDRIEAQY